MRKMPRSMSLPRSKQSVKLCPREGINPMPKLYAIACNFKPEQNGPWVQGMAICLDPDTPVTFICPNGKPYSSNEMWNYKLLHYKPWAKIEMQD